MKSAFVDDGASGVEMSRLGNGEERDVNEKEEVDKKQEINEKEDVVDKEEVIEEKKTASPSQAGANTNISPPLDDTKEATAAKNTKPTSIFDAAASIDLSSSPPPPPSSKNSSIRDRAFAHGSEKITRFSDSVFMSGFDFASVGTRGESKVTSQTSSEKIMPVFGAGTSSNFSFSIGGDVPTFGGFAFGSADDSKIASSPKSDEGGDGGNKEERDSDGKAASTRLSTAEVFTESHARASGEENKFGRFKFGTVGAACETPLIASSSVFNFGQPKTKPEQKEEPNRKVENENEQEGSGTSGSSFLNDSTGSSSLSAGESSDRPETVLESSNTSAGITACIPSSSSLDSLFSDDAFQPFNTCDPDVRLPDTTSSQEVEEALPLRESVHVDDADHEGHLENLAERPDEILNNESFQWDDWSPPDANENYDYLFDVEEGSVPPAENPTTVEQNDAEATLATEPGNGSGEHEVDAAALTRAASPTIQTGMGGEDLVEHLPQPGGDSTHRNQVNETGGHVRQGGRTRTAAEIAASWESECRERAEPPSAQGPWREPEWAASLPPLEVSEAEWSAELPTACDSDAVAEQPRNSSAQTGVGMGNGEAVEEEEEIIYIMNGIARWSASGDTVGGEVGEEEVEVEGREEEVVETDEESRSRTEEPVVVVPVVVVEEASRAASPSTPNQPEQTPIPAVSSPAATPATPAAATAGTGSGYQIPRNEAGKLRIWSMRRR